ncbi:MarR family winged helix-turn-helix transcriptional regulator [Streptomyces sp. NBC_00878]|uniref:MarR family winged helix-turn-helix transcriptional regulator n=1 Tax=Streptomyces sp. NBC_00878 TaxID=2975854 RepID=UPI00225204C5|nr:MarR family winged helix-turn-helix transcriptional regulator [Streptomyces sp. NBC_00878]MCX4906526.1 MarR family winged helix-turn-helix transcriptional regulator [Streptomyces sp. NBC_00878]
MTTQSATQPKPYPRDRLAAQPIGYWTGAAYREVVGRIRKELATESLTQPHWWILNHVAAAPARWTRTELTAKLQRYDDQGIDFDEVFDDLVGRTWLTEDEPGAETLTLTEAGEAGLARARERTLRSHEQTHAGITEEEYVATLDVLRRVITNLGGDSDLPE